MPREVGACALNITSLPATGGTPDHRAALVALYQKRNPDGLAKVVADCRSIETLPDPSPNLI